MSPGRVITGLDAVVHPPRRTVVAVGVFDGVHIAHQQLLSVAIDAARRLSGTSVAITFDPDPQVVLHPATAAPALMPLEARVASLRALGLDLVWVIPFTRRFARMTAEQFVRRILIERLRAVVLVVGEAFVFGRHRRGDMDVLRALGPAHGLRVIAVPPIRHGGQPVSSSRIRHLIREGRLAQARRLLGRPAALYGTVVRGCSRGRRLGFPTANIRLIPQVLPPRGVYAVLVRSAPPPMSVRGTRTAARRFACGEYIGGGVMNLGVRPTFGPGPLVCEAHLLGFSGSLRGRSLSVALLGRLRPERRFSSPQALVRQVRRDLARARRLFQRLRVSS